MNALLTQNGLTSLEKALPARSGAQSAELHCRALTVLLLMPLAEQRGGAEMLLFQLMQHGRGAGVRWVVVFLEDGPMVAELGRLGIETHVVPAGRLRQPGRVIGSIRRMARHVREVKADVVFSWMTKAHLYGGIAARMAKAPAVWFQHGLPDRPNGIDRVATMLPAVRILACSRAAAEAQSNMRPRRDVTVVYPAVDLDRFDSARLPSPTDARRQLGLPLDVPIIGIVARLQRWKGVHVLLQAMPAIIERHPDAHCVVVGGEHRLEPDYPAYLHGLIRSLRLESCVTMAGLQQNVPEWMQAMDVVVHASDREPFGMVVIEAMALGKRVVASNSGGPAEIITPGVDGLLSPPGDSAALADAVLKYLGDVELSRRIESAARELAKEFSADRFATEVIQQLREVAGARVTAARVAGGSTDSRKSVSS